MVKVYHYTNSFDSVKLHVLTKDFGESNTDKTYYRPDISSARSKLAGLTGNTRVGFYDFPNGVDTGDTLQTTLRSKSLDRTEVDMIGDALKANIENKKAKDKENVAEELRKRGVKDIDNAIKKIADSVSAPADSDAKK